MSEITVKSSTSATDQVVVRSGISANSNSRATTSVFGPAHAPREENAVDAVYGYIQAIRSLGRTNINTIEIVRALRLPHSVVKAAVAELTNRGVRPIDGR